MMQKKELLIAGLSGSISQPGNFVVVLEDATSRMRIPIIIGQNEAQAIAMAMERMQPVRPITHDLFKMALDALGAALLEVFLYRVEDGVFYCHIVLSKADGQTITLEARPSDALAMAARTNTPIFASPQVVEVASAASEFPLPDQKRGSLAWYSFKELEDLLQKLLEKEDYESASRIRDYIEKRKGGKI